MTAGVAPASVNATPDGGTPTGVDTVGAELARAEEAPVGVTSAGVNAIGAEPVSVNVAADGCATVPRMMAGADPVSASAAPAAVMVICTAKNAAVMLAYWELADDVTLVAVTSVPAVDSAVWFTNKARVLAPGFFTNNVHPVIGVV